MSSLPLTNWPRPDVPTSSAPAGTPAPEAETHDREARSKQTRAILELALFLAEEQEVT